MPAKSQLETDVFAEIVVAEEAPVDTHVDVPDLLVDGLLADHDILDLFVGDLRGLDELALAHLLDDDDDVVVVQDHLVVADVEIDDPAQDLC